MSSLTVIDLLIYIGFPLIVGIVTFIVKQIFDRITNLEHTMKELTTETEVRQMLSDKLDPIKEDITEIKKQLDLLLSLYIKNSTNS